MYKFLYIFLLSISLSLLSLLICVLTLKYNFYNTQSITISPSHNKGILVPA